MACLSVTRTLQAAAGVELQANRQLRNRGAWLLRNVQRNRQRRRSVTWLPAAQGYSGAAEFGPGNGKAGGTGFRPPRAGGMFNSTRLRLQSLGLAGVAAYGLLNTGYYVCTFLFFWCYVARVPTGQGIAASAKAFAAVMGAVWAGSQVTKGLRAAVALAIAPLVDRWMGTVQRALRLESKQAVFAVFVACCFSLAAALFGLVVLAWR
ncbi:hypothetical protein ACK3TF_000981 [Chlorella vulgaris]